MADRYVSFTMTLSDLSCDASLTSWNVSLEFSPALCSRCHYHPVLTDDGTSLTVVARYP